MIDYIPNLSEDKRKSSISFINNQEENIEKHSRIINEFTENSVSNSMSRISSMKNCDNTNYDLDEIEERLFGDIFSYDIQDNRINSIVKELNSISDTLSIMVYGEILDVEEAKKRDAFVEKNLKKSGQANNTNLYYLSKIFIVVNKYIDNLEKQVDSIKYINHDVNDFTSNDERLLLLDEDEINSIHLELKTSLGEQLLSTNFVSDNLIIKNYLCKFYNHLIDYNKAAQAIEKVNETPLLSSFLNNKEESIVEALEELIKIIEYSTIQGESLLELLFERLDFVKSFYK